MTLWKTLLLAVLDPWPDTAGFGLTGAHICPQEPWAPGPAEGPAGAAGCGTPGRWVPRSGAMSRGPHGHTEPWDRRTGSPSGAQPQPLSWAGKRRGWGSSASKLACVELPSEHTLGSGERFPAGSVHCREQQGHRLTAPAWLPCFYTFSLLSSALQLQAVSGI